MDPNPYSPLYRESRAAICLACPFQSDHVSIILIALPESSLPAPPSVHKGVAKNDLAAFDLDFPIETNVVSKKSHKLSLVNA